MISCKHYFMAATSVYSIRIDSQVRKTIDKLDKPSWRAEIRTLIEKSAREKRKQQILARVREVFHLEEQGLSSNESVRYDRDVR